MRKTGKVLLFGAAALAPAFMLAATLGLYALWSAAVTPTWSHTQLTAADLQSPALQEADRGCRKASGRGLMEAPTLSPQFRFSLLTEIYWSNGDVTVALTTALPVPLDARGRLHRYSSRLLPPDGLPLGMSVPGNAVVLMLVRTEQGLRATQLIATPFNVILAHQRKGTVIVGVLVHEIGEMNKGSVQPQAAPPREHQGPHIPDRNEGLRADGSQRSL